MMAAALGFLAGIAVCYLVGKVLNRKPRHRHTFTKHIVGHYDSITGPRTVVLRKCGCGARRQYTVRGDINDVNLT